MLLAWLLLAPAFAQAPPPPPQTEAVPAVTLLPLEGAIGPASADHVVRGLARAARSGSQLVVLRIDTPGGLDRAMRQIIQAILASPVPVAAYVGPSGARAASAGTFILYASHIAAMAPGTNLGAATPVQLGGGGGPAPARGDPASAPAPSASERKQLNDAVAYIRSLANLRGRNAAWAEQAVRDGASLPAHEALKLGVIELIADDVDALLQALDGRTVQAAGMPRPLRTADAPQRLDAPDWRAKLLAVVTDPSVALVLMMIGVYGLFFEFMNPGFGVPGVLGAICLLLALYALQMLPINYAGLALIALGLAFMAAEAFAPSFGILGLGGVVAFAAGALMLIDTELPGYGIPLALVVTLALLSALLIGAITALALKSRRQRVVTGDEALCDQTAEVLTSTAPGLWVRFQGERWQAASLQPLQPGQQVRVLGRRGLVLDVAPLDPSLPPHGG